jgi:multisubunit Na+/H+ antiporter MnhC subunit
MPIETAVVVAAIVLAFAGFALTLSWPERQTRSIERGDEKANAFGLAPSKA